MVYSSPATWTGGQLVAASDLNTQLRDNLLWIANVDGKITNYVMYQAGGAATTTAVGPVAITSVVTPSITTTGGTVIVFWTITVASNTAGNVCNIFLQQDAAGYTRVSSATSTGSGYNMTLSGFYPFIPSAAAHTYNLGWGTSGGVQLGQDSVTLTTLLALELRR